MKLFGQSCEVFSLKKSKVSFIYSTFPDKKSAEKCALALLEKNLIGCANFFESNSVYFWKKKLVKAKEVVCFMKTSRKNAKKVFFELEKIHPYEVPCILSYEMVSSKKYYEWLK